MNAQDVPSSAVPSVDLAEAYLAEGAALNPGPWVQHSRFVAQGARAIAERHPALDPERAYVVGCLHDIGRRFGRRGMLHIMDGYRFMIEQSYPGAARICMTHSFPVEGLLASAEGWKGSQEEFRSMQSYMAGLQYDDYDRLIQVCDALALPSGFCLMEKRLVDVVMRYGFNEHTLHRWQAFFVAKETLERAIDCSVYDLLPGVVRNTFGGGEE